MFNKMIKNIKDKKAAVGVAIPIFFIIFVLLVIIGLILGGISIVFLVIRNFIIGLIGGLLVKLSASFLKKKANKGIKGTTHH